MEGNGAKNDDKSDGKMSFLLMFYLGQGL